MENKTGKYFKYAIGEIVLVVIGILIALQINNWNENRKSSQIEHYYLNSLVKSIKQDTIDINFRLREINRAVNLIDSLSDNSTISGSQESLSGLLPRLYMSTFNLNIETSTIDDLKATGNLNLIKNKSLSELLLIYYKNINSQENGLNSSLLTYSRESIGPYLMKNYSVVFNGRVISNETNERFGLNANKLKEDLFLINALGFRKSILTGLKIAYKDALIKGTKILEMIDDELNE
jgi:hypothetical protein